MAALKDSKVRYVELLTEFADQLNESKEFLFTPNQAWKSKFYQAVRKAVRPTVSISSRILIPEL